MGRPAKLPWFFDAAGYLVIGLPVVGALVVLVARTRRMGDDRCARTTRCADSSQVAAAGPF